MSQDSTEALLCAFIRQAPAAIAMLDTELRYVLHSERWRTEYQLDGQDLIGKSHYEVFPDLPERWKQMHQRVLAGAVERCDEDLFPRADGRLEWLEWEARPWHRPDGSIGGLVLFSQVITARKEMEQARERERQRMRTVEAQLRQVQKMEAIGTLASGIAHDFNNILGAIVPTIDLVRGARPDDAQLQEDLDQVLLASRRAASLVRQILTFSRQQRQDRCALQVAPLVRETLALLRSSLPASLQLDADLGGTLPDVLGDPTQIHELVVNLVTNAAHAMSGRAGRVAISLARVHSDGFSDAIPGLAAGEHVCLTVSDEGHGMSDATLLRIFEPFFTTKCPGAGTGLGLAVVHGIVESHGGVITVSSTVGQGTRFRVFIPAVASRRANEPGGAAVAVPRGRGQHVLFVDDDPIICSTARRLLVRAGYRVTSFDQATNALAAFGDAPASYDLVITDLTMPRLSGIELAARVLEIRPELPILFTSSFPEPASTDSAPTVGARELVLKPLDLPALLQHMDRLLGSR